MKPISQSEKPNWEVPSKAARRPGSFPAANTLIRPIKQKARIVIPRVTRSCLFELQESGYLHLAKAVDKIKVTDRLL